MTIRITAITHPAGTICCDRCQAPATRIQMTRDHEHNPNEHWVLCKDCMRRLGLVVCGCCDRSDPFEVSNGKGVRVELWPAYELDELDSDGCCSEHP